VAPAAWEIGARVRLVGVAVIQYAPGYYLPELLHPNYVEMLVRNGEDFTLLQHAPWWTAERLTVATAALALLLLGAGVGVILLQRLLRQRTERLEQVMQSHRNSELEMKGARQERFRLAADLHDSLQQHLTGASYRLEAALLRLGEPAPAVQAQFAAARAALERTRTGLRETLFALRKVEEGPAEFPALLRHAVEKMEHWPPGAVEITAAGEAFPLSRHVMGSLLLFMQEAVANALRHGAAKHVRVVLTYESASLEMRIVDDGSGFNPDEAGDTATGHFGLSSMRDRLRWLGGAVEIRSRPGEGTSIIARLSRAKAQATQSGDAIPQETGPV
jgi:signal transduction histidine kinase